MDAHGSPRLMDRVRRTLRVRHYSLRTEKAYCYWIRNYIRFRGVRHPASMGAAEVRCFLEYLAVERRVAAATQNQALNALVYRYRHVLEQPLGDKGEVTRARRARRLPTVLSHAEVLRVIGCMRPALRLTAQLMYGSGLRVTEVCQLRFGTSTWIAAPSRCEAARATGIASRCFRRYGGASPRAHRRSSPGVAGSSRR